MVRPEPGADLCPPVEVCAVRACRACKGLMEPVADPSAPWLKGGWICPVCAPQIPDEGPELARKLMGKSIGTRKSGRRWRPSKSILR